jgi:hypothetical protein
VGRPRCTAPADAICQHLNPEVRPEHRIDAHLVQAAAGFDIVEMRNWEVATHTIQAVLARHPRLGFKKSFGSAMCAQAAQHHGTRTHFLYRYMQFGARINRAPHDDCPGPSNQGVSPMSRDPSPAKLTGEPSQQLPTQERSPTCRTHIPSSPSASTSPPFTVMARTRATPTKTANNLATARTRAMGTVITMAALLA